MWLPVYLTIESHFSSVFLVCDENQSLYFSNLRNPTDTLQIFFVHYNTGFFKTYLKSNILSHYPLKYSPVDEANYADFFFLQENSF